MMQVSRGRDRVGAALRDPRIDFLRGLAPYVIFFDHIFGDPLAIFTYRIRGFFNATRTFFFFSGIDYGTSCSCKFGCDGKLGFIRLAGTHGWTDAFLSYVVQRCDDHACLSRMRREGTPRRADILVLYMILTFVLPLTFLGASDRYQRVGGCADLRAPLPAWRVG
jgi:OpgC protein